MRSSTSHLPRGAQAAGFPWVGWVLCVAWALSASAQVPSPFADSLRHERSGDFAKAIEALGTAPKGYATSLRLGWLSYLNTNHTVAVAHYRAALDAAPRSLEARLGVLLPLLADGRFVEAESGARDVLREHKSNYLALLRLAVALRLQQRPAEAARVLSRALRMYPADNLLLTELGLVRVSQGRFAAARFLLNEALTLNPDNDTAFRELADPRLFADLAEVTAPASVGFARAPGFRVGDTASRFDAVAYAGWVSYEGTAVKDTAALAGVAGWLAVGAAHVFEGGLDFIDISRPGASRLRQLDATLAYNNFSLPGVKLRLGAHRLSTDDAGTDGGWVGFGGVDWFAPGAWNTGADVFVSHYADLAPPLDVVQVSPHLGWNIATGADCTLRSDSKAHWIVTSADTVLGRRHFFSAEERLSVFWKRWSFATFGWFGRQAFAVRGDGATPFNLPEKHTGGFGAELRWTAGDRSALSVRVSREEFREVGATRAAAANSLLAFVGITF